MHASASTAVSEQTRVFLLKHVRTRELKDSDDYFTSGLINSLFAMQLVMFVEKEFGIQVENEDLNLDNFRSIDAIVGFVSRKRAPKDGE